MPTPIAESALNEIFRQRAARMEARGGWQVPAAFGSVEAELAAARTAVALGERTELGILEVEGADLPRLAERLGVAEATVGTAVPLAVGDADRRRWCRLTQDRARVLVDGTSERDRPAVPEAGPSGYRKETPPPTAWVPDGAIGTEFGSPIHGGLFPVATAFRPWLARTVESLARHLQAEGGVATGDTASSPCIHLTDLSSGLTTLQVLGPRSPDLLARIIRIDLDPRVFRDRTVALTGAVGIPLQILRWDWSPVLGYELTVGRDVAVYFWDALEHVGHDLGLKPIGAEALARLQSPE
jgi:glycine cleavage system aminomethyltransferase T